MEKFKDIKGYEGLYQISDMGRVKRLKSKGCLLERFLKVGYSSEYQKVSLHKKGNKKTHDVHRLVADSFIPNPNNKPQVNHIDGNKHNNRLSNLEYVTPSENAIHAFKLNLRDGGTVKGQQNGRCKLTEYQVIEIIQKAKKNQSMTSLGREYSVSATHITRIVRGERWVHLNNNNL